MSDEIPNLFAPKPGQPTRPQRQWKPIDIVAIVVVGIIIVVLSWTIISKLSLKHEVTQAKVVTSQVVAALAKQDTKTIRSLGDKSFQAKNSAASLNDHLTATAQDGTKVTFAQLYSDAKPSIDSQVVANNSTGQHVAITYRYDKLKAPFYVRIEVAKTTGSTKWTLQSLSAGPAAPSTDDTGATAT